MIHNEFVNIWTHLIGAIIILGLIIYFTIYIKGRIPGYLPFMKVHFNQDLNKNIFKPIYNEF